MIQVKNSLFRAKQYFIADYKGVKLGIIYDDLAECKNDLAIYNKRANKDKLFFIGYKELGYIVPKFKGIKLNTNDLVLDRVDRLGKVFDKKALVSNYDLDNYGKRKRYEIEKHKPIVKNSTIKSIGIGILQVFNNSATNEIETSKPFIEQDIRTAKHLTRSKLFVNTLEQTANVRTTEQLQTIVIGWLVNGYDFKRIKIFANEIAPDISKRQKNKTINKAIYIFKQGNQ